MATAQATDAHLSPRCRLAWALGAAEQMAQALAQLPPDYPGADVMSDARALADRLGDAYLRTRATGGDRDE